MGTFTLRRHTSFVRRSGVLLWQSNDQVHKFIVVNEFCLLRRFISDSNMRTLSLEVFVQILNELKHFVYPTLFERTFKKKKKKSLRHS